MVDIAILLAQENHRVTIITTPVNAIRMKPSIDRAAIDNENKIRVVELNFKYYPDTTTAGGSSSQGYENLEMLPSLHLHGEFIMATRKLQKPFEKVLGELKPRPNVVISDSLLPFTLDVCQKFGVPRIVLQGTSSLCLLCMDIMRSKEEEDVTCRHNELFVMPDLPHKIQVTKDQVPSFQQTNDENKVRYREWIKKADDQSFGVVLSNTFEVLEPDYVTRYRRARWEHHQQKVWCIGPVFLCSSNRNNMTSDNNYMQLLAERGGLINQASSSYIGDDNGSSNIVKWHDSQRQESVVYACLGSQSNISALQMKEMGLGLEASSRPFIWVIRGGETNSLEELEEWISTDGFEKRVTSTNKERGLLIRGWAPQALILCHPAVGAFLTHCGMNSLLEGICAGVPLLTCPLFYDQFLNEKLVLQS